MLDLDAIEKRIGDMDMDVRPLIAEVRRLRRQLYIAQCPLDHAVMSANGEPNCPSCPWENSV